MLVTLLVLLGLSLAACGRAGDDDLGLAPGDRSTTTGPSGDGGEGSSPPPASGGSSTTAPRPSGTEVPPTTAPPERASGPPETAPAPGSGDVEPTPTDDGSQGPPGAFARTLLRPQPATSLVIERAAQSGAAIDPAAFERSAGVLREVTGKPVELRPLVGLASQDTDWNAEEVRQAADRVARTPQGDGRAVVRTLLLQGRFEGSTQVLGVVARGDVLALFVDNIADAATPFATRKAIEDAVLLHEFGHVLGLVDLARDTGRADKEHPGHSSNRSSVMYWAVESSLIGQVIGGPPPRDFDAQDLADLRALRNGA